MFVQRQATEQKTAYDDMIYRALFSDKKEWNHFR